VPEKGRAAGDKDPLSPEWFPNSVRVLQDMVEIGGQAHYQTTLKALW
jgi:hypothetical protein